MDSLCLMEKYLEYEHRLHSEKNSNDVKARFLFFFNHIQQTFFLLPLQVSVSSLFIVIHSSD